MKQAEALSKQARHLGWSLPVVPALSHAPGRVAWIVALGLLAASLYMAPSVTTLILVAAGLSIPMGWVLWRQPELGLLAIVFLTSSFIEPDVIDVRLPVGGLDLRDFALLGMIGLLLFQALWRGKLAIPWWRVSAPLIAFLGYGVFSALYAILLEGVVPHLALGELRSLIFYATFFVAAWAIRQPNQLSILLAGLFVLADLTVGVIILQQFTGLGNYLLAGMSGSNWHVWQADATSRGFGTVRIIPPGHVLVYVMSIVAFCRMVSVRQAAYLRAIFALQCVYLNAGLVLTYTRAQWIASAVALGLAIILLPRADKLQLTRYALIVILALLPVIGFFGSELLDTLNRSPFVNALASRALSVFTPQETLETYSLEWRRFEMDAARQSIEAHPLLGVGLGNAYRDVTLLLGEASSGNLRFTRYVHISYLAIAVKLGLPGLMVYLWFCLAFLLNGWRVYVHLVESPFKSLVLAALVSFAGLLVWNMSHSLLVEVESTAVIGLMVGWVASVGQIVAGEQRNLNGDCRTAS